MSVEKPLVSVAMLTYGHEKYIQKALDSILMQKVNFSYEIIVGEDCSPDKTREILKKYEKRYPEKFIMIYQEQNVGAFKNEQDVLKSCRGKYVAFLEGDDYWTEAQKLQRQVDYLEDHENCIATAHRIEVVDEFGQKVDEKYPECHDRFYTLKHFRKGLLPGQLASIVCRNIYIGDKYDISILDEYDLEPGDRVSAFVLTTNGEIYCFPEIMSAYRHVTTGGSSYSATKAREIDPQKKVEYYYHLMQYAKKLNSNQDAIKVSEVLYFFVVIRSLGKKGIDINALRKAFDEIQYKSDAIIFIFYQVLSWPVRRLILKQEARI